MSLSALQKCLIIYVTKIIIREKWGVMAGRQCGAFREVVDGCWKGANVLLRHKKWALFYIGIHVNFLAALGYVS